MKLNRAICEKCHRVFSLESSSNSTMCASCLDDYKAQKSTIPNRTCSRCFEQFYTPNSLKICPFCSKKGITDRNIKPKTYDPKDMLKEKKQNLPKFSIEEMIRRKEWKRVMDNDGWDHYLRGRKWDKI